MKDMLEAWAAIGCGVISILLVLVSCALAVGAAIGAVAGVVIWALNTWVG